MKTLTTILATLAIVSLTGCGYVDRAIGAVTGYSKVCVEGVSYLQFTSGAAIQLDVTGKPVACK